MLKQRIAAALACALMLAVPATALAQSAGDQQYFDPVGPDSGGSSSTPGGSSSSDPSGGSSSSGTPAPAPATGTSAGSSTSTPATAAPTATAEGTPAAPGELPRTGGDPLIVALFGAAMLLTGAGTRLLVVRDPL
jgi:hypothetical protein